MTATRSEFLAERATGVGGSDVASLFNLGYGCRLRLWREKRGETPDYPQDETGPMALGKLLEPYFADKYAEVTGRRVSEASVVRHPEHPEALVHIDRLIHDPLKSRPGVLEIKAQGREVYYRTKREGLPVDYILQVQHGMLCSGAEWGAFAVGSRDIGVSKPDDLLQWDVARDGAVCNEILREVVAFWGVVANGPAPETLDPDDKRCQKCPYRKSCQGAALMENVGDDKIETDESLRPLLTEYDERAGLFGQAEELLNETKETIRAALGNRNAVKVAGRPIYFRPQTSRRWDGEAGAAAIGKLAGKVDYDGTFIPLAALSVDKQFKKSSSSRPLRIF